MSILKIISTFFLAYLTYSPLFAHVEHEHPSSSVASDSPLSTDLSLIQRLFVSKSEQTEHHLSVHTAALQDRPKTLILPGKIIASPNSYAQIHAVQASKIVSDPKFPMPNTGDLVTENQVIAVLEPLLTSTEITSRKTDLYKIEGEIVTLKREIIRLTKLGQYAAQKTLENTKTELERAERQKEQILNTGLGRDLLRTPISGIVGDNHLLPGQVVHPDQTLLEVINPKELRAEAYSYDPFVVTHLQNAYLRSSSSPQKLYSLNFMGISPRLNTTDQAQHILFSIPTPPSDLLIGTLIDVLIMTSTLKKQIVLPQKALVKEGKNFTVFVLAEPELIISKPVQTGTFFDDSVEILEGIQVGEQVIENIETLKNLLDHRKKEHVHENH